jgi:hypothetical protein
MKKNKKIIWIIPIVIAIVIVFIGASFAYLRVTNIQSTTNTIASQCLDVTFVEESNAAILKGAEPMTDEEGLNLAPYTFKITNNCSDSINYVINLDILKDLSDSSSLQLKYVKISLDGKTSSLLSSYNDTNTTVSKAYSSKELYVGSLKGNKSISYNLRLWLDEDTTLKEGSNKLFLSKIIVTSTAREAEEDETEDNENVFAKYITTLASTDTTNLAYDGTEDNNLRYIGSNPSNYLCFDEECSNGKWRVIGVMNNMQTETNGTQNLVKIIRERVGLYAWDSNKVNDWTTASLNTLLNSGDLYISYIEKYDDLFESVRWKLGGTESYTSSSNGLASHWYTYERGTTVYSGHATEWTGKIALMYPSDFGYATSGGSTTDRATCLAKELYNWSSSSVSDCKNNDYLYDSSDWQWTLTPYSANSSYVFRVSSSGYVSSNYGINANYAYSVRPVGYLISTAVISSGSGTSDDPWIITE